MKPLTECRLYAFVDTAYLYGRTPESVASALCDGGADLIQLRAKGAPDQEIRQIAENIRPLTERAGVGLVINDYLDIALQVGADFCHLGQEDFLATGCANVASLRNKSAMRIGLSTHSPAQAEKAVQAGADYIAVGPVYATGTKPAVKPVTLDYVRWAAEHVKVPWFAIGGINLQNLDEVLKAGARTICVVSAILNADNVAAACRGFAERMERAVPRIP